MRQSLLDEQVKTQATSTQNKYSNVIFVGVSLVPRSAWRH